MIYSYQFDPCAVVLSDPSCPGYAEALAALLAEQALLNKQVEPDNPYDNDEVQEVLNSETKLTEERNESVKEENEEENRLNTNNEILEQYAGQAGLLDAYSIQEQALNDYYTTDIPGGIYNETVEFEPNELADNRRALRNFASDTLHRRIVRSQYE